MLPSSPHVRQAMLGEKGVLETIAPPTVYIDTSTIDPITSRDIAGRLEAKGVAALDAPVTKGVKAAIAGELSIYVGGEESVLSAVRPVLEAMGSSIYHMGPIGAGQTTKLANAVCLAAITAASAEAVVFGAKAGVDPDKLVQAIFQGSGSSRPLKTHIHDYAMRRTFDKPAFPVHLMMKDLTLVMDTAREMDLPVFFTSLSHEVLAMLKAKGRGKGFFAEVMTIYEDYAGITVEGGQDEL
jgi:3-hydroxyisobutyrate dehydrogenase-like beta-hydroxyacid dehydrogenase